MSVATEIARIKSGVSAAYTAVKNKGVETSKTKIEDLAGEISKIQTGKPEEEKTTYLDMVNGDQVITPTDGKAMSKVTVKKPFALKPSNIRIYENIGGVVGTLEGRKPEQAKSVTITANKITTVLPDSGKTLSKVTITTNVNGGGGGGGGYSVYFDSEWTGFYGSGRMGTVKITHADGTEETSTDNNLNSASYSNVSSVTFTETEGESWSITYEMGGSQNNLWLSNNSTETLTLTGNTTFNSFSK